MGSTIKRPFRTFNGADWDTHYFDTSEDMIKSGWVQSLGATNCYRKFPGGYLRQWGKYSATIPSVGYAAPEITFPIAFPNYITGIQLSVRNSTGWRGNVRIRDGSSLSKLAIIVNDLNVGDSIVVYWAAEGN